MGHFSLWLKFFDPFFSKTGNKALNRGQIESLHRQRAISYFIIKPICLTKLHASPTGTTREMKTLHKPPIRIAAIFSQTGIAASHNEPLIPMVQLAVEDINMP